MAESQDTNTCVVCFKDVVYYSIGECDHPVCFECSTRMRVLCLQNECPICRQDLSRVVFTESIQPYKELRNQVFTDRLFERQFKIGFCSEEIKNAYEQLLENRCKYCDKLPPFRTFSMLSDHMRKAHERYFCDLCVKHLKRKCYTRQELAHHRRKGDLDDTSHRGHPLCEFCEERFMDADELYRHLRKEHLYCHLCDADGRNLYYASHAALAQHFRTDHFLCEEGECANNHLTAVFRTEIDLKAHKATVHGRGMTRGAARQARTLELQFNITPHPVVTSRGGREREREREREQQEAPSPPPQPPAAARIDTRSDAQFPRLSAAPPQPNILLGAAGGRSYNGADNLARNEKNFPCLGGGGGGGGPARPAPRPQAPAAAVLRNSKPSVSIQLHSQPASASNFRLTQAGGNRISIPQPQPQRKPPPSDDDFPSLGKRDRDLDDHPSIGAGTVQPPKIISRETHISIPQSQGKPPCDDEFPSLGKRDRDMDDHPSIEAGILQPPKVALINSQEMQSLKSNQSNPQPKKAPLSSDAFPALGGAGAGAGAAPAVPPQWITVKKDKRPARPEPPPPAPRPAFNPVADFPTLPANAKPGKKSKTPVQQQFQPPPAPKTPTPAPKPQEQTPKSKKEKKKPNPIFLDEDGAPDQGYSYINGITDKFNRQHIRDAYAAAMDNNNQPPPEAGKKIKTVVEASTADKRTNGGTGDFALAAAEFPSLNPNGVVTPVSPPSYPAKKKTPNGNAPPPPPPGFKSRPPCDGMTFTNSSGQTFPAPLHNYIPPPNFEQRNRALVKKFAVALGGAAAVEDFKVASRAFRDNIITADEFYEHCRSALGPQLDSVFPDLVALLPDIAKQQELVVGRDIGARLEVCSTCGQLLAPADRHAHDTEHWPALS